MKSGLDYFPLDVHLDDKFALIEAEFGLTGFGVVVKLYQKIYGERGYYVEWTSEVALLFAHQIGVGGNVVSEIVSAAIKRGIFDKEKFDRYSILTSKGIQDRYFEAVSRRVNLKVKQEYLFAKHTQNQKNGNISDENVNISDENADIFRESKEKKIKEDIVSSVVVNKDIISDLPTPTHTDVEITPQQRDALIRIHGPDRANALMQCLAEWKASKPNIRTIDDFSALTTWVQARLDKQQKTPKARKQKQRYPDQTPVDTAASEAQSWAILQNTIKGETT